MVVALYNLEKKPPSAGENMEWKYRIYAMHINNTQRKCIAYFDVSGEYDGMHPRRDLPDLI